MVAERLNKVLEVRLDVLFEKEQLVINVDGTKNNGMMTAEETEEEDNEEKDIAKTFIVKLYKETDDPHDIHKAVMEVVSCIEEKIKQKEFILSILEDAQQRRGKKLDGKVMKVLLWYKQHLMVIV